MEPDNIPASLAQRLTREAAVMNLDLGVYVEFLTDSTGVPFKADDSATAAVAGKTPHSRTH